MWGSSPPNGVRSWPGSLLRPRPRSNDERRGVGPPVGAEPAPRCRDVRPDDLLFFCGLFVVVYGLRSSGLTELVWDRAGDLWRTDSTMQKLNLVWVGIVGSNVVSNVPFINLIEPQMRLLEEPEAGWMILAMATTFAGNLTLLGSVANIIVMETSGEPVGFWKYFKVGLPTTILSAGVGTAMLLVLT